MAHCLASNAQKLALSSHVLAGLVTEMKKLVSDSEDVKIRIHRAKSWARRANDLPASDLDGKFIFYWIAFNALYGQPRYPREMKGEGDELRDLKSFVRDLCDVPEAARILRHALNSVDQPAADLMRNQFLIKEYWEEGLTDSVQAELWNDVDRAQRAWRSSRLNGYPGGILRADPVRR